MTVKGANNARPVKEAYNRSSQSDTKRYIQAIAGIINEDIIQAIMMTGANKNEIRQACDQYFENSYTKPTKMIDLPEKVRRVYDILDYSHTLLD